MKLILTVIVTIIIQTHAANILFLFPLPSPSHKLPIKVLIEALASQGHHVTLVSSYSLTKGLDNCSEIILNTENYRQNSMKHVMNTNFSLLSSITLLFKSDEIIRVTLNNTDVKNLLQSKQKFDVIVQQLTLCEALLGVGYYLQAPTIVFNTIGSMFNIDKLTGNSHPPAYVPDIWLGLTDEMSFIERLKNTLSALATNVFSTLIIEPIQDRVLHEYFPEAPPLTSLASNISLVLLNAHYSIVETPRPYMPNMIPIGGFHVQMAEALPNDLMTYMNEAKDGVVLFSLGSNFKSADLPTDKLKIILETFAEFPQRFLWKFEDDSLEVPPNVLIRKWLPQIAVLSHPNTKAFISHGGLLSVTEAVYHAVPFIGIPVFGDQLYNVANAAHEKFALQYDFEKLSKASFTAVIKEILENHIYKQNIAIRSSILRNQPVPPLDLAVHWIELVAKYGGVPYLQSVGAKLGWLQSYLVDVALFISVIIVIFIYICYKIVKLFLNCLCTRRNKHKRE